MHIKAVPLYHFLNFCNESPLEKTVLDCGAGGSLPPLSLFLEAGYQTYGIDLSLTQIANARAFEKTNGLQLNIHEGNMQHLQFADETFSFIYSYNSIFHMSKSDIQQTLQEIFRVLKPTGLCFINLLSVDDERCGEGKCLARHEYLQKERGEEIIHSYYEDSEADPYFKEMKILFKEKRITEKYCEGEKCRLASIDYIVQKTS